MPLAFGFTGAPRRARSGDRCREKVGPRRSQAMIGSLSHNDLRPTRAIRRVVVQTRVTQRAAGLLIPMFL
jgi:hypothetical protein